MLDEYLEVWIVTVLRHLRSSKRPSITVYDAEDIERVGIFFSESKATTAVEENRGNISEDGYFDYVVIEKYSEGIRSESSKSIYYRWDKDNLIYQRIDNPTIGANNWGIR